MVTKTITIILLSTYGRFIKYVRGGVIGGHQKFSAPKAPRGSIKRMRRKLGFWPLKMWGSIKNGEGPRKN